METTGHFKKYYYLALGDSYTIGQSVPAEENFPSQATAILKQSLPGMQPARIIAKTGWTTDELETGIVLAQNETPLFDAYDFVTLLIGVNNQYRGRTLENYKQEFKELLLKAIQFAGNRANRVIVLSIPDWGVTPFATGQNREQIAREIDAYNVANRQIAEQYHTHYLNITPWTREAANDPSFVAADGLHPSGKEYKQWAEKIAPFFLSQL